ncbi:MAG: sugar ABC transporter permease [Epulopiscium sp. Nele67-Bin004]|nr:MAG: sugar ABC transporter permease [Epulopiscium sp. Nele67-Bin004]
MTSKVMTALAYAFIIAMSIITLFPFVYMILASLMTFQEATSIPPTLFPAVPQFENYSVAMSKAPFGRYFFNTVYVAGMSTFLTLVTTVLAGFAFAKLQFKGKKALLGFLVALMMVPYEVVVFSNYQTIAQMKLMNTYTGLIIPSAASVFYIFYLKGFLESIPMSYYNVAKVTGASDLEFITKVMLPLAKPALFTMSILSFIGGWNSFIWPVLITNSTDMRLLGNGLSAFATESGTDVHLQMAASTITIIPILLLYFIFRRQIIRGVVKSGVKG